MVNVAAEEVETLLRRAFARHGMPEAHTALVAATIVAAERDGTPSHGLSRLRGYLDSLASGWINARPELAITDTAPGTLHVDADNGFAQVALSRAAPQIVGKARACGVAALSISNSHHFAALWPDVEPFAQQGLLAITVVNTRALMTVWGGTRPVLGTNPMAFACPRADGPPIVWDQASSVMSQGDVRLHALSGTPLPAGVGVDREGQETTDAARVLDGGALLPFAEAKGGSIAFMVEVLAAALTGGRFGFEDESARVPGATTSNAGQFVLLIDTANASGGRFAARIEGLVAALRDAGSARMPGTRRYARRARAAQDGFAITEADAAFLRDSADGLG